MVASAMASGSSQSHLTPLPAQQSLTVQLEQAQRLHVELIKRLKVEQDSGNCESLFRARPKERPNDLGADHLPSIPTVYEAAVGTLYARLSPRQLVAYLDHRLATEDLSASMRVSSE